MLFFFFTVGSFFSDFIYYYKRVMCVLLFAYQSDMPDEMMLSESIIYPYSAIFFLNTTL